MNANVRHVNLFLMENETLLDKFIEKVCEDAEVEVIGREVEVMPPAYGNFIELRAEVLRRMKGEK